MKNINPFFCFRKKLLKTYHLPLCVIFQSFLSIAQLQILFGDHRIRLHFFNINRFWEQHYPVFFLSRINTYMLYINDVSLFSLNNIFTDTNINIIYIFLNNRFYQPRLFNFLASSLVSMKQELTSFLTFFLNHQQNALYSLIALLKKAFFNLIFLLNMQFYFNGKNRF